MQTTREKRRRTTALLVALPVFGIFRSAHAADAIARPAAGFMADPRAVGLSVGVIRAGTASTYHVGTAGTGRPVADDRTLYPIASLTKTFTGTLLAQAHLDGKLALDDDIRRHLDGDYPNLAFEGQPIRIHHLVNHVSGLPRLLPEVPESAPDFPSDVPYPQRLRAIVARSTRADFYAGLHRVTLAAPPGTRFAYSNAAAQLAGYILERVHGAPFETLVRERIAAPLRMPDTCIALTAGQRSRLADGYEAGQRQPEFPEQMQAAGALKSTLADLLAYARWHLAEQDPAVRLAHQPTDHVGDYTAGLNWQILQEGGRRVLFQDGTLPGYASMLVLYPDNGMAIVVLSNEIDAGTVDRLRTLVNGIARTLDGAAPAVP